MPDGTSPTTRWIWWIVLLPVIVLIPLIGYFAEMNRLTLELLAQMLALSESGRYDPALYDEIVKASVGVVFSPWVAALFVIGWGTAAIVVWFCYLDRRDLEARGFPATFHWAWGLLSTPLVYVIGRTVKVRRATGGRGAAPLWVTIAVQALVFLLAIGWVIWFNVEIINWMFANIPTS